MVPWRMDKSALIDQLQQLEERISTGSVLISRERKRVIDLQRKGDDTAESMQLIIYLDEILMLQHIEKMKLQKEIAELS